MPAPDWTLLLRTPAFETTALLLGLVVGSFANVCIHRLPLEREPATGRFAWAIDLWRQASSVVHPPSHCPRCGRPIRAVGQRADRELAGPPGPLPLLPRPDLVALSRGRGHERPPLAGPRRDARPGRADARGDGLRHRSARPHPHRPRAPAPPRRRHAPRRRPRPRRERPARLAGPAARGRSRRRGRLARLRPRGPRLEEAAPHRRPRRGRLEDGGHARGLLRVGEAPPHRPPRLGFGRARRRPGHGVPRGAAGGRGCPWGRSSAWRASSWSSSATRSSSGTASSPSPSPTLVARGLLGG